MASQLINRVSYIAICVRILIYGYLARPRMRYFFEKQCPAIASSLLPENHLLYISYEARPNLIMHEERNSDSPHIQFVWRSHATQSGSFEDVAHDFWVIAFNELNGKTKVWLTGPSTKSRTIVYEAGQNSWGIVFKAHVFIFNLPKVEMLNASTLLPMASASSFLLGTQAVELANFFEAEKFVDDLVKRGLLNANLSIGKALAGSEAPMSIRSLQRHFLSTTGLTKNKTQQIARARQAFALLQQGKPIADAVFEAGYADQAHMTRALKLLAGQTPKQILRDFTAG
jgi:AraC-like DNA-binding protein